MIFLQKTADLILGMDKIRSAVYNATYTTDFFCCIRHHSEGKMFSDPEYHPVFIFLYSFCVVSRNTHSMNKNNGRYSTANFVICDIQKEYAEYLLKLLADQLSGSYQFFLFQDIEKANTFIKKSGAEITLICEEYEEKFSDSAEAGTLIILTEQPLYKPDLTQRRIFRYQSAGEIIKSIKIMCGRGRFSESSYERKYRNEECAVKESRKGEVRIRDKPGEGNREYGNLIGIYSPVHRIGKTRFAMKLGRKMAEDMPVLYLNMEGYAGTEMYFHHKGESSLGDLLYIIRQERCDHGLKISAMTGQIGGMDYVLPMENEQDLKAVTCREWIGLFDMISEKCIYEAVILDLGESVDGLYDILRKCSKIYTPYISEKTALSKLEQYEKNLVESGYGDILRKTVKKLMNRTGKEAERIHSSGKNERTMS